MDAREENDKADRIAASDPGAALAIYRAVLERWPENFRALMGAGRSAAATRQITAAIDYFRRAAARRPDKPEPILHMGQQQARIDLPAAARTYAQGRARFPDHKRLRGLETKARINLGLDDAGFDLDAELENPQHPEPVFLAVLKRRVGALSEAESARYYGRLAEIFQRDSSKINHAMALVALRDHAGALQVFGSLSQDDGPRALMGQAICHSALGDFRAATGLLERIMDGDTSDHMVLRTCANFLDASPDLAAAAETVRDLNRRRGDPGLANLLEFAGAIRPPERAVLRGNIRDDAARLSAPGAAGAAVLVFAGFALQTGAVPFSLIDRFFAGHGVATGSFFDAGGRLFWDGIPALGDTLETTVAGIRDRLAAQGTERIYTLGSSGGGVGAIVYGTALGARRALSFSGPTDLRQSFLRRHGDTRGQAVIHALQRRLDDRRLNLRGWLEARQRPCPIHAYYCAKEEHDAIQARNIAHLAGVSLHPVAHYAQHESIGSALGTGDLLREFNSVLEDINHG